MEKKIIVFQGDSITDAGRTKDNDFNPGFGYADMVMGELGLQHPYAYEFYNRGISGNRVVDLYARMRRDMIHLKPDVMSVLIGINDVWHEYVWQNGVEADRFERIYAMMIEDLRKALPDLKLMLLEPFVLPGCNTTSTPEHPNRWEYFWEETTLRREAVKRLAEKYGCVFVPLQQRFLDANADAPSQDYWLRDGVHPTPAGHALIKARWLEAFSNM